jgi:membrane protein implicated in regulation of membrane protease activity
VGDLALGRLVGGPARPTRASTSLVSGVRANGPALAIAAVSFHGRADVRAAVITFAIFSILGTLALAAGLSRRATRSSRRAWA